MSARPAVIIPTHDGARLLADVLDSLATQTLDHSVVVVDNGSTDGTAALLADSYPHVTVVRLPQNVGFGRAVNRGVAASESVTVVLLNNDVVCPPEFLEALCGRLNPTKCVVMASGVLVKTNDPARIDTAGIIFDRTLLAVDYLQGEPVAVLDGGLADPLGPSAGAAAFDRAAFLEVGGFDERFFAYLEDVDLVARMLARGGRCRLARDARAVHRHSATLGAGSGKKNELMGWSRGYTIGKYRLHRRPTLFARAAAAELAIAAGQLVVDRTAVGFTARIGGLRAGLRATAEALPVLPVEQEPSFASLLRGRARRGRRRQVRLEQP